MSQESLHLLPHSLSSKLPGNTTTQLLTDIILEFFIISCSVRNVAYRIVPKSFKMFLANVFLLQEVAEICYIRLNLILIAIEARKDFYYFPFFGQKQTL